MPSLTWVSVPWSIHLRPALSGAVVVRIGGQFPRQQAGSSPPHEVLASCSQSQRPRRTVTALAVLTWEVPVLGRLCLALSGRLPLTDSSSYGIEA